MKLLVLTSRYTAMRDIIGEDFGRQVRLFAALKKFNHDIDFLVADYKKFENKNLKLHDINVLIRPFSILKFFSFIIDLNKLLKNNQYNYMVASSDPLWGIMGYVFAKKHKIAFVYDLQDNYEIYDTYKLPFLKFFDNYVLKKSDLVTTVSHTLKNKISKVRKQNVFVVQNGVDLNLFQPMDKKICRRQLKLPLDKKIIVYTGSIQRVQGIDLLIDIFNELKKEISDLNLVMAGRFIKGEEKYINLNQKGIIYLSSLTQDKIVKLINAADVAIVPNPENEFTKYCFPYKVVEYMACNVNIVATNVGDVGILLKNYKNALCEESNKQDMVLRIKNQLTANRSNYRKIIEKNSWENIASQLTNLLTRFNCA